MLKNLYNTVCKLCESLTVNDVSDGKPVQGVKPIAERRVVDHVMCARKMRRFQNFHSQHSEGRKFFH